MAAYIFQEATYCTVQQTVNALVEKALSHSRGKPDTERIIEQVAEKAEVLNELLKDLHSLSHGGDIRQVS
ncbi:hypothetical protein [Halalkalibacter alkalisediminis]|uniref:Uncharacterized protein n=1 Tax=Halalkalibacter alkalisediminis TaxID=935616 RepID=A0ABV6NKV7_9BACI